MTDETKIPAVGDESIVGAGRDVLGGPATAGGTQNSADRAEAVQPPSTNRGVVFTVCVDWLTVSIPGINCDQWAAARRSLEWLHFEDKDAVFGHGYNMKKCAGYGGIGLRQREGLLDGAVNLPGEALRYLAAFGMDNKSLLARLRSVPGARLTRLDAAIDIYCDRVKVPVWWEKIRAKQYASRSRGKPKMRGDVDGVETIYVGSNKSPRQLRMYDKTIEQQAKGIAAPPENWTRIELQHRDKAADRAGDIILSDGLSVIPSLIGGFFRLLNDAEWDAVVTGQVSLKLPGRPVSTPEQKVRWVTDQKSGIPKITQLIELCDLSGHLKQAMQTAEITDQDIRRWIAAFKPV